MKTNLDSLFKTNENLENEGVVFDLGNGMTFTLRRFGGANRAKAEKAMAKYHAPYAKLIAMKALGAKEQDVISAKVIADACLIGWTGIKTLEGEDIPYNFDNAVSVLSGLPSLLDALMKHCNDDAFYKEDLGNS